MSASAKMEKAPRFTRTDVSAMISILLFTVTIIISAVGPAEAQGTMVDQDGKLSPTVSYKA